MIQSRLSEIRKKRGLGVSELAKRVGVSRQTIYAIEDGSYIPNTSIALQLARELEVTVEDLFSLDQPTDEGNKPLRAELLGTASHEAKAEELVRLCRVRDRLIAVPIPALPAYLPQADAVVQKLSGRAVSVKSFIERHDYGRRFLIAGCDPALSLLTELLASSGIEIVCVPCPSRSALQWLKEGRVHAAGSHLLDRATSEYNVPIVRRVFAKGTVRVLTFAGWEQGLVVQPGNPKEIRSIADLARKEVTVINREEGSGSRDLLDEGLKTAGLAAENVRGYSEIAAGHLSAAYTVAAKHAECCVATSSAARRFGLDFIPLAAERFDLTFSLDSSELTPGRALLEALQSGTLRKTLRGIAGYETRQTGQVQL